MMDSPGRNARQASPAGVEYAHVHHAAGAVAVAKAAFGSASGFFQQAGATFLAGALAIEHEADVLIDRVLGSALHDDFSVQHEGGAIGQAFDQTEIVRYQEHGDVLPAKLLELLHASAGEDRVADGERFVDDQDLGIDVNRGGKCQANVHSAGVFFDRPIDELADFGEGFDAWKRVVQFLARESQDLAIEIHIFAAAEFRIEAGA